MRDTVQFRKEGKRPLRGQNNSNYKKFKIVTEQMREQIHIISKVQVLHSEEPIYSDITFGTSSYITVPTGILFPVP